MLNFACRFSFTLIGISRGRAFTMPFYAVARGKKPGVYIVWDHCKEQITGFPNPRFKKFDTEEEAKKFIRENGDPKATRHLQAPSVVGDPQQVQEEQVERSLSPTLIRMQEELKTLQTQAASLQKQFDAYIKHKATEGGARRRSFSTVAGSADENDAANGSTSDQGQRPNKRSALEPGGSGVKKLHVSKDSLVFDENEFLVVYTDGACSNNGYGEAKAGLGVWFNYGHPLNISEPVSGRPTNNVGEIQAATKAIEVAKQHGYKKIKIVTDSEFVINAMTKWIFGWKKKNWTLSSGGPVKNKIDFMALSDASKDAMVKWEHCRGHAGVPGNEAADALARKGAERYVDESDNLDCEKIPCHIAHQMFKES